MSEKTITVTLKDAYSVFELAVLTEDRTPGEQAALERFAKAIDGAHFTKGPS